MKLVLKNKNIFVAKNDCEIQVRTILVCTLYSIKYGIVSNPLSEEQCLLQSVFNDAGYSNQFLFISNGGRQNRVGNRQERGRERKGEIDQGSRRQSIGDKQKWRGMRKVTIGKDA